MKIGALDLHFKKEKKQNFFGLKKKKTAYYITTRGRKRMIIGSGSRWKAPKSPKINGGRKAIKNGVVWSDLVGLF